MGRRSPSARPLHLLPFMLALLAALGWTGLQGRRAADARAALRPAGARPFPARYPKLDRAFSFEPGRLDLGRLEPGLAREASVTWRLDGPLPCRVLGVDATCGCVVPTGLPRDLQPGDAGALVLAVRPPHRAGPFRASVKVWLHPAPAALPPTLEVHGYVHSRFGVRPDRLALGPRKTGVPHVARLEVDLVEALAAATVEAEIDGLAGSLACEPTAFAGRPGVSLRVDVHVPTTPGPFEGRVVVRVAGEPGSVVVPVTGEAILRR